MAKKKSSADKINKAIETDPPKDRDEAVSLVALAISEGSKKSKDKEDIIDVVAYDEPEYYDDEPITAENATYNIIYGPRSNGKTYKMCRKILDGKFDEGLPSAYIRRLDEMIKPANLSELFNPHIDYITERSGGKYNGVAYKSRAFYLAKYNLSGDKIDQDREPFCRCYAVNTAETTKGQDAGEVKHVVFDEFITRQFYLTNEFILFQNLLSSIVRARKGVKIWMIANTVSKYCPYFAEMGLDRIKDQKQGTIDIYTMGKTATKIAVEYCGKSAASQKVSEYYCFSNPELQMITNGEWEISLYRHIPKGINDKRPEFEFYVKFDGNLERGALYLYEDSPMICFTRKTTEIKDPEKQLIFGDSIDDPNALHSTTLDGSVSRAHALILGLIKQRKTYYGTNEDGEIISNWINWARKGGFRL